MLRKNSIARKWTLATLVFWSTACLWAAGNDPSEKGVPTSPLSIYSGGIAAGAFYSINEELRDESEQFLKLSFTNHLNIRNNAALFMDADWFLPGPNFGGHVGFDYLIGKGDFRPLVGLGVGANFMEKGDEFGKEIGASATAHVGLIMGLTERSKIRIRVPYYFITNDPRDMMVGLDVGVLFSSGLSHVKKLHYR